MKKTKYIVMIWSNGMQEIFGYGGYFEMKRDIKAKLKTGCFSKPIEVYKNVKTVFNL